jgi:hypothetical protein
MHVENSSASGLNDRSLSDVVPNFSASFADWQGEFFVAQGTLVLLVFPER